MIQKKTIIVLLLLLEVHMNYGQKFSFGACKTVKPMPAFDITKYFGTWYLYKEYSTVLKSLFKCQKLAYTYSLSTPNQIKWEFTQKSTIPFLDKFTGTSTQTSPTTTPAVLNTAVEGFLLNLYKWDKTVLATDYLKFSVVYGCKKTGPICMEHVHILSRAQGSLDPVSLAAIDVVLADAGISSSDLALSTQTSC